jgi:RHS repeat-associated protein
MQFQEIQPMSVENETQTVLLATDQSQSILAQISPTDFRQMAYSPYGHRLAAQRASTSLGFNGEYREQHTGWYILGNGYRAYNPVLRRFHSPDGSSPFDGGGLNAYAYCLGDPINYRDPTGHLGIFRLGASLLSRLATPAGALTATAVVSGVAAVAVMDRDSAVGTALLVISAASGLGAGYLAWAGRPTSNLTGASGKTAFSGRSGSAQQYKRLSSDTRLPKPYPDSSITAKEVPRAPRHRTQAQRQTTTAPERKEYWPDAAEQEMRRRQRLQEQQIARLRAALAQVNAEDAALRRRGTRPTLQRQNANMRT